MHVTYLGHAAILVRGGNTSLLMDPWLEDPAYCNSWFHYPPLQHRTEDVIPVDYIWCSHDHPDHFDPKTLAKFPRDQKILVPQFASGRLESKLRGEGFTNLIPLPFGVDTELDPELRITCRRTDLVWEDSALIVQSCGVTLFNMNDCKLGDELLAELGERYQPDLAFLPFSGAIHFPTCYGYPEERLIELCRGRRQKHLDWFVHRAALLQAKHAIPFAGNFALLHPEELWMNEPEKNNFNTPDEAIAALAERRPDIVGLQMNPGDEWTRTAGHVRPYPVPDFANKMREVRALAASVEVRALAAREAEPPARPTLREDVAEFFADVCRRHPELGPRIAARVVIEADGPHGGRWCFAFGAAGLAVSDFQDGDEWNLWMQIPPSMLQLAVDGAITWDELALSFRVRFRENPEFFNRDFWVMLYNPDSVFLGPYLADPSPRF
ncbi:MAG: MBL fold metallo-hydrolase [Planctomycetota bacterium]